MGNCFYGLSQVVHLKVEHYSSNIMMAAEQLATNRCKRLLVMVKRLQLGAAVTVCNITRRQPHKTRLRATTTKSATAAEQPATNSSRGLLVYDKSLQLRAAVICNTNDNVSRPAHPKSASLATSPTGLSGLILNST
jgi:hypothetical protein